MDFTTIIFWIIGIIGLIVSLKKDKKKTLDAMKMSKGMMKSMGGQILGVLFLIGLILTFLPPEIVSKYLGGENVALSTLIGATVGSVTLIPAFVAFPLVDSFVQVGASLVPSAAFLTTLTMVGIVTFPLEKEEFGVKFTALRNILGFVFALIIALGMGVIM